MDAYNECNDANGRSIIFGPGNGRYLRFVIWGTFRKHDKYQNIRCSINARSDETI